MEFPPLQEKCPICEGEPWRFRCDECDGKGYVPTDFGEAVLSFMRTFRSKLFSDD